MESRAGEKELKEENRTFRAELERIRASHPLFDAFGEVVIPSAMPIARSGQATVYQGMFRGVKVAVKVFHCDVTDLESGNLNLKEYREEQQSLLYVRLLHELATFACSRNDAQDGESARQCRTDAGLF